MNFIVFMICMIFAIIGGMVLEGVIIRLREDDYINQEYEYSEVGFLKEEYARIILEELKGVFEDKGFIRVYDLYLLSRIGKGSSLDFIYGWNDISEFNITENDDGYVLNVPEPHILENSKNKQPV